jgi:hypothetical protein
MPIILHQEVTLNKQAAKLKHKPEKINDGNLPNKSELLKKDLQKIIKF